MKTNLSEIGQIEITVSDVGKVLPFYRDILGLEFLFSSDPSLVFLAAGSVKIMISTTQGAGSVSANSILYFKTQDIEAVRTAKSPLLRRIAFCCWAW